MTAQPAGKPPSRITATWKGDEVFEAALTNGSAPAIVLDGNRGAGPSPVDTLLGALASCSGIDVVSILAKRRTPVESMTINVIGDRAQAVPSRVTKVLLEFKITGTGIEREHALRAIELSVTKYCSVRDTLDRNMPVEWTLELNGKAS